MPPPIITSFNQQAFGPIEIDACGGTAVKCNGDFLLDGSLNLDLGQITTSGEDAPALSMSESNVNVSGTVVSLNGTLLFENVNASGQHDQGIPYFYTQPTTAQLPPGSLYWTKSVAENSSDFIKVLCIA